MPNILAIDDSHHTHAVLSLIAKDMGHDLTHCLSSAEGLQALEDAPHSVILVALDTPGLRGVDLVRRLSAAQPTSRIFAIASNFDDAQRVSLKKLGVAACLDRPLSSLKARAAIAPDGDFKAAA